MGQINGGRGANGSREEGERIDYKTYGGRAFKSVFLATFMATSHLCGILLFSIKANYAGISHNFRENSVREDKINVHKLKIQVSRKLNYKEGLNCFLQKCFKCFLFLYHKSGQFYLK